MRNKDFRDGAIPSGNSIALLNLIRLARLTGDAHYEEKAAALAKAFSSHEEGIPSQNTMFLTALDFFIGPAYEIVVVGNLHSKETRNMLQAIRTRFIPNKVVLFKGESDTSLENLAGFTKDMKAINNKVTVHICKNFVCSKPLTNVKEVLKILADAF